MRDQAKLAILYHAKLTAEAAFSDLVASAMPDSPESRAHMREVARATLDAHKHWWAEAHSFVDWEGY